MASDTERLDWMIKHQANLLGADYGRGRMFYNTGDSRKGATVNTLIELREAIDAAVEAQSEGEQPRKDGDA